jgi:hypothetical protein
MDRSNLRAQARELFPSVEASSQGDFTTALELNGKAITPASRSAIVRRGAKATVTEQ